MLMLMKRDLCTAYYQAYRMLEGGLKIARNDQTFSAEERDELIRSILRAISHVAIEHNEIALAGTAFDPRNKQAVSA